MCHVTFTANIRKNKLRLTLVWKVRHWAKTGSRKHWRGIWISYPAQGKRSNPIPHLTATEILEEVGEALDHIHVVLAVFTGVAEEDLGLWPEPVSGKSRGVCGGLGAFFI